MKITWWHKWPWEPVATFGFYFSWMQNIWPLRPSTICMKCVLKHQKYIKQNIDNVEIQRNSNFSKSRGGLGSEVLHSHQKLRQCSSVVNLIFNPKFGTHCVMCDMISLLAVLLAIQVNLEHIFNMTSLLKQSTHITGTSKSWNSHCSRRTKIIKEHIIDLFYWINIDSFKDTLKCMFYYISISFLR